MSEEKAVYDPGIGVHFEEALAFMRQGGGATRMAWELGTRLDLVEVPTLEGGTARAFQLIHPTGGKSYPSSLSVADVLAGDWRLI